MGCDGERTVQARLALADVRRLVAELPAEQRGALMLVAVDGLSYAEAADVLGVPAGHGGEPGGAGAAGAGCWRWTAGRSRARQPRAGVGEEWMMRQGRSGHVGGLSRRRAGACERRREVEGALAVDPQLRARLAALERVDAALEAAFDPILNAPLPALALTERPSPAVRRPPVGRDP